MDYKIIGYDVSLGGLAVEINNEYGMIIIYGINYPIDNNKIFFNIVDEIRSDGYFETTKGWELEDEDNERYELIIQSVYDFCKNSNIESIVKVYQDERDKKYQELLRQYEKTLESYDGKKEKYYKNVKNMLQKL